MRDQNFNGFVESDAFIVDNWFDRFVAVWANDQLEFCLVLRISDGFIG